MATANITLGLGLQDCNANEKHPEMLQEALTDVDQHYDKCKQADEQKRIVIEKKRQEKLRRERIRKEKKENTPIYMGRFKITYYWIGEDNWGYRTALGVRSSKFYTVAVDPDVIPLGSKVIIGHDIYWAVDTGSEVKGNIIDIFSETKLEDMYHDDVWLVRKGSSERLALKYRHK